MCLAIPGQIIGRVDTDPRFAMVDVMKVRRVINVDLLADERLEIGDWVLIHVGFAMTKISEAAAQDQLRILAMLGEDEQAMEELTGYRFDPGSPS